MTFSTVMSVTYDFGKRLKMTLKTSSFDIPTCTPFSNFTSGSVMNPAIISTLPVVMLRYMSI